MDKVIVGKSKIGQFNNKLGVYANRDFKKGETVIRYNLEKVSSQKFNNLSEEEKQYTHNHYGQLYLYSIPERYVNHSNNPNTSQNLLKQEDVALRDIKKGEEITTNSNLDDT